MDLGRLHTISHLSAAYMTVMLIFGTLCFVIVSEYAISIAVYLAHARDPGTCTQSLIRSGSVL